MDGGMDGWRAGIIEESWAGMGMDGMDHSDHTHHTHHTHRATHGLGPDR